jgi:hypothetical protein
VVCESGEDAPAVAIGVPVPAEGFQFILIFLAGFCDWSDDGSIVAGADDGCAFVCNALFGEAGGDAGGFGEDFETVDDFSD